MYRYIIRTIFLLLLLFLPLRFEYLKIRRFPSRREKFEDKFVNWCSGSGPWSAVNRSRPLIFNERWQIPLLRSAINARYLRSPRALYAACNPRSHAFSFEMREKKSHCHWRRIENVKYFDKSFSKKDFAEIEDWIFPFFFLLTFSNRKRDFGRAVSIEQRVISICCTMRYFSCEKSVRNRSPFQF